MVQGNLLQALQTQRLKWTLKHAYENVPMYRRKFDAAGVHPDDFRELNDLQKFPCTTKQDLRDNYPFDTFAVPMEQVVRAHHLLHRHREGIEGIVVAQILFGGAGEFLQIV